MVHDFIVSWSTMYSIIQCYGLLYRPFSTQIMDNYIDHNLYFHGLICSSIDCKNNGSLYLSIIFIN